MFFYLIHFSVFCCRTRIPILLLKDVKNLGKTGEKILVKRGYMRNHLFPKGMAEYVTRRNLIEMGREDLLKPRHKN